MRAAKILLMAALASAGCAQTVSFYRVRIEYSTTSDWSTLEIENPEHILSLRRMGLRGNPARASAQPERLSLNQPLADAQAGQEVGITVDYALEPAALVEPWRFVLKKGALKGSVVRVLHGNRLIREVNHTGAVPGDPGYNTLRFTVDLSGLQTAEPSRLDLPRPAKMVWAFYYPWYTLNSWTSSQLQDRPLTPYASDDPKAIARQIEQAQAAGIDGFISSWWGPGHYTDRNLKLLLEAARVAGFRVTIYFETLRSGQGRDRDEIYKWLSYFIPEYRDHPALMKVNGKPLIVVWASESVPLATWSEVFAALRSRGLDAVYLAMGRNAASLEVFDGLHEYGVFTIADLASAMKLASRATRHYPLLEEAPRPRIWASTVQPGYDERTIPGRKGLYQDRLDGAFYRSTWEAALGSDPDWVFICTWNEWWEHTHIEPSELYQDQYLQITREYARRWKGRPQLAPGGVVNAASYAAGAVAPGEIVAVFGTGFCGDARVLFDGHAATVISAGPTQINAVVPYSVADSTSTLLQVDCRDARSEALTLPVAASAPGIFTADSSGRGQGAILNQDGGLNSAANPAARGSVVQIFATGEGETYPPGVDGKPAAEPLPKPLLPVSVSIGGLHADVLYAGGAPGLIAGVFQVNVRVPAALAAGPQPVVLTVGAASSQPGVTVSVK